jgi:hypothetical protein
LGIKLELYFPIRELFTIFDETTVLRVIAKKTLREFWKKHGDCEEQLKSWYQEAEKGEWKNSNELRKEYPSASILKGQ